MRQAEDGFTLVETVVGLVVMSMMVAAIGHLFVSNLQTLTLGKSRAIAAAAASEQMEYLRDLPYDSVKTVNGPIYPAGTIQDHQLISRGGHDFYLDTDIRYVDDPYDGNAAGTISGKPKDLNPADYKRVQIGVRMKVSGRQLAKLSSDVAGKAAETASNTGIISVLVVNAAGTPVNGATVKIYNANPSPDVDITTTTDNQGFVVVPNLPPDSGNRYQVTASKPGMSTDATVADPSGAQTAAVPHLNVIAQNTQTVTLAIDEPGTLELTVTDPAGAPLAARIITVRGSKFKYRNPDAPKYNQAAPTTDAAGRTSIAGLEWDSFSFVPPAGTYLVSSYPAAPAPLAPGGNLASTVVLTTSSTHPTISKATPVGAVASGTAQLTLTGTNLTSAASVRLRRAGQADLVGAGVVSSNGNKTLRATFNLTGAAQGPWDIVVTTTAGTVNQTGGFNVTP